MAAQVIKLVLVLEDGSVPDGTVQPLEATEQEIGLTQWGDFEVHFDFWKADRSAAAIPGGAAFMLAVRRENYATDAVIAVEATITNNAGGEDCGYFPIDSSLTGALVLEAIYSGGVVYIDAAGKRWQVLPSSPVPVGASIALPDTEVTPGASQPPLGLGPNAAHYATLGDFPDPATAPWTFAWDEGGEQLYLSLGTEWRAV